jgi:hypothetical protein
LPPTAADPAVQALEPSGGGRQAEGSEIVVDPLEHREGLVVVHAGDGD